VNRNPLSFSAARRTRPSAFDTPCPAQCPGRVLLAVFPLARPLPSTASAPDRSGLFDDFAGTMGLSDFPRSCISDLRQLPSPSGPSTPRPVGTMPISLADRTGKRGISRFSLTEVPHVPRISDRAGSAHDSRNNAVSDVAFRPP